MKLYIIFILLICNLCIAQDTISIAKQDTVYVILPETDESVTLNYNGFKFRSSGNGRENEMTFFMEDNRRIDIGTRKFDKKNRKVKRKDFFKKNKDRIITLKFIETYSPKKIFFDIFRLREPRTVVYVIDEKN